MASLLRVVQPELLETVWPIAEPMLRKSLGRAEDGITIEQTKLLAFREEFRLVVILDSLNNIKGAMLVKVAVNYNYRSLFVVAFGGRGVSNQQVAQQLAEFARSQGCKYIEAFAEEAAARLYRMTGGFEEIATVVRKRV